jgi:wobble nucleotide-excising tRNase
MNCSRTEVVKIRVCVLKGSVLNNKQRHGKYIFRIERNDTYFFKEFTTGSFTVRIHNHSSYSFWILNITLPSYEVPEKLCHGIQLNRLKKNE